MINALRRAMLSGLTVVAVEAGWLCGRVLWGA